MSMSSSSEQFSPLRPPSQTETVDVQPSAGEVGADLDPTAQDQSSHSQRVEAAQEPLLKGPPRRPAPSPTATAEASTPVVSAGSEPSLAQGADQVQASSFSAGQQPIPPPSEPMQYRAIGLVWGQYQPSEDQFNRGLLVTEDNVQLDAVLLGQVLSLVKKYVDLEQSHFWVVYPRTRDKEETLHLQIVGVWSADGFGDASEDAPSAEEAEEAAAATEGTKDTESTLQPIPLAPPLQDGYFSIRGEVVFQSIKDNFLLIKIQQAPRKHKDQAKAFKLKVTGSLTDKTLGYFWDLQVLRQGEELSLLQGQRVGLVPPKRRSPGQSNRRPSQPKGDRQGKAHSTAASSKPIKRRSTPEN